MLYWRTPALLSPYLLYIYIIILYKRSDDVSCCCCCYWKRRRRKGTGGDHCPLAAARRGPDVQTAAQQSSRVCIGTLHLGTNIQFPHPWSSPLFSSMNLPHGWAAGSRSSAAEKRGAQQQKEKLGELLARECVSLFSTNFWRLFLCAGRHGLPQLFLLLFLLLCLLFFIRPLSRVACTRSLRGKGRKKYFPRAVLLALSIGRHAPGLSFCVCVLLSIDVEATTRETHTKISLSLSLVLCLSAGPLIQSGRGRWLLLISVKAMATQHTAQRIPLQSPFFCDDWPPLLSSSSIGRLLPEISEVSLFYQVSRLVSLPTTKRRDQETSSKGKEQGGDGRIPSQANAIFFNAHSHSSHDSTAAETQSANPSRALHSLLLLLLLLLLFPPIRYMVTRIAKFSCQQQTICHHLLILNHQATVGSAPLTADSVNKHRRLAQLPANGQHINGRTKPAYSTGSLSSTNSLILDK